MKSIDSMTTELQLRNKVPPPYFGHIELRAHILDVYGMALNGAQIATLFKPQYLPSEFQSS